MYVYTFGDPKVWMLPCDTDANWWKNVLMIVRGRDLMGRNAQEPAMARRLVIVTGASSGVGYATVRRLVLNEGATVVAIGRRRMFRIESLANQVEPGRLTAFTGDMASRDSANALIGKVVEQFGQVDAFVHSVNRALKHTALEVSDTEFDLTMQVNVKSALYGVQALATHFRRQRKGVVVIYNPTPMETAAFVAAEAEKTTTTHTHTTQTTNKTHQHKPNKPTQQNTKQKTVPKKPKGEQNACALAVVFCADRGSLVLRPRAGGGGAGGPRRAGGRRAGGGERGARGAGAGAAGSGQ